VGAARQAPPLLPGAAAFLLDLRPGLGAAAAPELGVCCVPLAFKLYPRGQLPLETEGNIVSLRPAPVLPLGLLGAALVLLLSPAGPHLAA
jgi:hypothetical protein